MVTTLRSLRQKIKQHRVAIAVVAIVLVVVIALIIAGYRFDWTWTGFNGYNQVTTAHTISGPTSGTVVRTEVSQPGKTLWDWLQLLFVPAILTLGAVWFTARYNHDIVIAREQHENEQSITLDNQREAALQAYLDKMSELLLEKKLRDSAKEDEVQKIAHVRTLAVLPILDEKRKGIVLQFLHESDLITKDNPIISLYSVDLSGVDLSGTFRKAFPWQVEPGFEPWEGVETADQFGADLDRVNLRGAILNKADLSRAKLEYSNLSVADLRGANLSKANLYEAILDYANLSKADLRDTDLREAKLREAKLSNAKLQDADLRGADLESAYLGNADLSNANLSNAKMSDGQLDDVFSLKGATMPDGSIHP